MHPKQPGFLFETPSSSSFQGFPNIQHLREILKSQRSPKSWRKSDDFGKNKFQATETPQKFHVFVGLFFALLSMFVDISFFFWVGREKKTVGKKQKAKLLTGLQRDEILPKRI